EGDTVTVSGRGIVTLGENMGSNIYVTFKGIKDGTQIISKQRELNFTKEFEVSAGEGATITLSGYDPIVLNTVNFMDLRVVGVANDYTHVDFAHQDDTAFKVASLNVTQGAVEIAGIETRIARQVVHAQTIAVITPSMLVESFEVYWDGKSRDYSIQFVGELKVDERINAVASIQLMDHPKDTSMPLKLASIEHAQATQIETFFSKWQSIKGYEYEAQVVLEKEEGVGLLVYETNVEEEADDDDGEVGYDSSVDYDEPDDSDVIVEPTVD
ncbi:MAG: hypothetical protein IJ736_12665, partial [Firmicutes bacterium]|nr:hypothetical protein [Bacillota bacterium]